ncbi:thiamine pyrophosphate-binding protein [Saccharothrix luteola]|uniref:thiamine pyrophosphate-binding protein n=1 Tax=Saccharothrix luteola TaxID=2893018 RepID=UPI001E626E48|nr:thiamine pyrophosphate-binding protein [Saccharothrix luteola]MCC8250083.1 thiamine pyrophosphate-binding protein [Saccharothrix luteola]
MTKRPGRVAIFEQFAADGITHMFGNPGTVEQGLLDAMGQTEMSYVLALQESVAVAMADGYARASQRPGLVQLHTGVGLGNAVGMLYQAKRGGSPLVVIAGDAGVRYDAMDAQMAVDLVAMAEPVTKYATRVTDPDSVLRVLRRAVKIAMTPPRGPVFVALPADVLDAVTEEPALPTVVPSTRVLPEPALVARMASVLSGGRRPLVLMGDGVATSGAQRELATVAQLLGARVYGVNSSEVNIDAADPSYAGNVGHMFGADSARIVGDADRVLIVGTYVFPEVFPSLSNPFSRDARIVHIDLDAYEIAKNHPVEIGVVADPKLTLAALAVELGHQGGEISSPPARPATRAAAPSGPPSVLELFTERLAQQAPNDLILFDEALTAGEPLGRHLPAREPGRFFQTRGGSLGIGIPGALGAKLARPDQPVIAFTGDGGSMYTIQALWTAARHDIDAKFVICNNGRYRLLDHNIDQYWREQGIEPHERPGAFDLTKPAIGFTQLAASLGVPGRRVSRLREVDGAVAEMLSHRGPFLIDLVIE